jgi:hypothetical protein
MTFLITVENSGSEAEGEEGGDRRGKAQSEEGGEREVKAESDVEPGRLNDSLEQDVIRQYEAYIRSHQWPVGVSGGVGPSFVPAWGAEGGGLGGMNPFVAL